MKNIEQIKSEVDKHINSPYCKPITTKGLIEILNLTIKNDNNNKVVTFIGCLLTYTEDSQINISFNGPSSTGKSYIALEIAKLFPEKDVIKLGNCSKTAFFHEQSHYDQTKNEFVVDLSRKILIFTDMPHTGLLESLRSFLSHDEKIMYSKITDKSTKGGLKTKNVALVGFPSVIFCTAGSKMDQQEMTRFILLSPEVNQEKLRAGIANAIVKESDNEKYKVWLENDPNRQIIKKRIINIRDEKIKEIKVEDMDMIRDRFLTSNKKAQPRHQRDIKRLISLVKGFALLNLWWRKRIGNTIIANKEDVEEAFKLWDEISVAQELNIPPYIHSIFTKVIMPAFNEKNTDKTEIQGITRGEIMKKHYEVFETRISLDVLRFDIIPTLYSAGLITKEKDKKDARVELIVVVDENAPNNSVEVRGVEKSTNSENSPILINLGQHSND